MNELAKEILERIADWPEETQAELLQALFEIEVKHFGVYRLLEEKRVTVREGLAQAERGEFATDEQVAAVFNRYRK
jgi:predicted transcriptional regulator